MEINYTLMNESHVNGVYELSKACFSTPWSLDSISKEITNKNARYIIATDSDKVIGFVGIWIVFGEGDITNIAVDKNYRNLKIGSNLLKELFKLIKKENCEAITLEVRKSNIPAQKLYKNFGFVEEAIRKKYYDDGEDAIIMWNRNL